MNSSKRKNTKVVPNKIHNRRIDKVKRQKVKDTNNLSDVKSSLVGSSGKHSDKVVQLNYDCLAKIFMYLPVLDRLEMEKVCQRWKVGVQRSWCNVKKLDFNDLMISLEKKEQVLTKILVRCCQYLTHLTIVDDHDDDHYDEEHLWIWDAMKNNCQNITHFDINMIIYDDETYCPEIEALQIITSMSKLKYLRVKIDRSRSIDFCTEIFERVPDSIEEIHLISSDDGDFNWMPEFPVVLPNNFTHLRCLTLQSFRLTYAMINSILEKTSTLVYLDFARCHFPQGVSSNFSTLNNLEHLNLDKVGNLDNDVITVIARNCPKLKHFEFLSKDRYGNQQMIPHRLFRELKYLKDLEHLNFYNAEKSDDGDNLISDIANNCKKMKHLNVEQGDHFSLLDIQETTKLKNLEYLDLWYARIIDSQSVINIASNCLELKELNICLDNISATALQKLSNLKKLQELYLEGCRYLTGNVLTEIVSHCKNLVNVDITGCNDVTETSLIQIGKLQYLEELSIACIEHVPNSMFQNLFNLKNLSCYDCPSVTDEGIIKVIDNCKSLSELNVRGTGITLKTLVHASKRRFVFNNLNIKVDKHIENNYNEKKIKTHYLSINVQ